jgi:hypothetical protein
MHGKKMAGLECHKEAYMKTISRAAVITAATSIIVVLHFSMSSASGTAPVEMNHWAYDIVERFAVAGYVDGYALNTRPYTRSDFVNIILQVDSLANSGFPISDRDRDLLDKLKTEFEFDLNDLGEWPEVRRAQYHLLSWYGSDYRWVLDPVARAAGFYTSTDKPDKDWLTNTSTVGIVSRGYFKDDIDFYFYFRDTRIGRKDDFTSKQEVNIEDEGISSVTLEGNNASYDRTYASLSARLKWLDARICRYKIEWGPSPGGGLLLSDYAVPFDMLMLQYPGKRVRATFIAGSLMTDEVDSALSYQTPAGYRENYKKKYLAAHRLEFLPWRNLTIGLSESAIYGERGFDLGYLIPVMFYWSEQHYLGDRDNMLMSIDITYYPKRRYQLYLSLLIDDLSIGKLGDNYWGNKWAVQVGAVNTDPLGLDGLSVGIEYVRIEPYVYTHFYRINSFSQHDQFLGYPMQPNSDRITFKAEYWAGSLMRFNARLAVSRHGDNPPGQNVGGDIFLGHRQGDPETKDFLSGIEDNDLIISLDGSYEFFPEAMFSIEGRFHRNDYDGLRTNEFRILASLSYRYY